MAPEGEGVIQVGYSLAPQGGGVDQMETYQAMAEVVVGCGHHLGEVPHLTWRGEGVGEREGGWEEAEQEEGGRGDGEGGWEGEAEEHCWRVGREVRGWEEEVEE